MEDPPSPRPLTAYEQTVHALSHRLLAAQRPVRVLEAVHWDAAVEEAFFSRGGREPPPVTPDYYARRPLRFDPAAKDGEFRAVGCDAVWLLGRHDPLGRLLRRRCDHYRAAVAMLARRGTPDFARRSHELYGRPNRADDAAVEAVFAALAQTAPHPPDPEPMLTAAEAAPILRGRLRPALGGNARVRLSSRLLADAVAGNFTIKLRRAATFTAADLRLLEVHEGWVHLGTTINGRRQPVCAFLGSGPPTTTPTQEGLAVCCELLTGAGHAGRVRRLWRRYQAVRLAAAGADFCEVFRFFREAGEDPRTSYHRAARVFRGSLPSGCGPFAKDATYALGLVRVLRAVRAALHDGQLDRIVLLFCGKTSLDELGTLVRLTADGLLQRPVIRPPGVGDPGAWARAVRFLPGSTGRRPAPHFFARTPHAPLVSPPCSVETFYPVAARSIRL